MTNINEQITGPFGRAWSWFKALPVNIWFQIADTGCKAKKLGEDDPRRIIHACKVGLAITLVSLFFYFNTLYDGFGVAAMWAVLTVVVVFEFSVGMYICSVFTNIRNRLILVIFFLKSYQIVWIKLIFSGATLGKGVNRAIATLLAGSLGVGAHHLAVLSGEKVEPYAIGTTVFLIGT